MRVADFFCGGGGASEGCRQAGASILAAANHDKLAVEYHELNHPEAVHFLQDLNQMDFNLLPDYDLAWASVPCTTHSSAKGNRHQPNFDESRATAWAVVTAAEFNKPKAVIVENVVEFQKWELYPVWISAMEAMGYKATESVLNAQDFGVGQSRVRLFVSFVRGKTAIPQIVASGSRFKTAEEIIDWDFPKWTPVHKEGRAQSTIKKWEAGRARFGERFMLGFYGKDLGRSIQKPVGTLTTKERWAIVRGDQMRMLSRDELIEVMGFPKDYILPKSKTKTAHLLGNAVVPAVAKAVFEHVRDHIQ